jgi:hypothetical protein
MRKECDKKEKMRYKCENYKAKERRNEEGEEEEEEDSISPDSRIF